jgi:outer membrane lipopolysaccharide assembly protein LptE/RlpB
MKTLAIILLAAMTSILAACNHSVDTYSFIPGTYVNHAEGEFSIAYDTLIIQPMSDQNASYRILRKTGFRRVENNHPQVLQRESEEWVALYNDATKSMQETKRGKVITFYPDANRLMVGKREYQKIK